MKTKILTVVSAFCVLLFISYESNACPPNPPSPPSGLTATAVSSTQINLAWTDNSSNETGFRIERKVGAGSFVFLTNVSANVTSYPNTSCSASTTYTYRVRAYNSGGSSGWTNEASDITFPAAPSSLTATAVSSTQIDLQWTDNSSDETGFRIERKVGAGSFEFLTNVSANATSHSDTSCSASTTYTYRVRAYSGGGDSAWSNEASDTTFPAAPTSLAADAVSSTQIDLQWTDNSSDETGFRIERKVGAGSFEFLTNVSANATSHSDTSCSASTTYTYRVRAYSGGGDSAWSNEASDTTAPLAPASFEVTVDYSTKIDLSWTDVADETGYEIEVDENTSGFSTLDNSVDADEVSYNDLTASPLSTYSYRIRAKNAYGNSDWSTSTTYTTGPAAPATLTATADSSSQISLDWSNVAQETGFKVDRSVNGGDFAVLDHQIAADDIDIEDTPVSPSNTYIYRVRSTNAASDSAWKTSAIESPDADPPTGLTVTGSKTFFVLNWDDNGAASYNVYKSQTSGTYGDEIANVTTNSFIDNDSGLSKSTTYYYAAKGLNAQDEESASFSTEVSTPLAPANLSATAGKNVVDLDWDNVTGVVEYAIYRSTSEGGPYTLIDTAATSDYEDDSLSLINGTTYYYVVAAIDSSDNSSMYSDESFATPDDPAPAAPVSFTATLSGCQVNLDWANNTESDLEGYRIYKSTSEEGPYNFIESLDSTTSEYSDDVSWSAVENITYYYAVTAYDSPVDNESEYSEVKSAEITCKVRNDRYIWYCSIQSAIDAAIDGDVIVLSEGTHNENINFNDKKITLTSTDPTSPEDTVIDGGDSGSVLTFDSGDANSTVIGITIYNGSATSGGGINCSGVSPIISSCIISDNQASSNGGGIYLTQGSMTLIDTEILSNSASSGSGGAIYGGAGAILNMKDCTIGLDTKGNSSTSGGGAIYGCSGTIERTIIQYNSSGVDAAGISSSSADIRNCVIMQNSGCDTSGSGTALDGCSGDIVNCTIINNSGGQVSPAEDWQVAAAK